jgi:hypothetical protein
MEISTHFIYRIADGWLIRVIFIFTFAATILSGCNGSKKDQTEIEPGLSREEVTRILGDPNELNEFVLPNSPFFGPQEGLTGIVPPGQLVEEWVFHTDGEIRYVWFWGKQSQDRGEWSVILTSVYPKDAVF